MGYRAEASQLSEAAEGYLLVATAIVRPLSNSCSVIEGEVASH